MAALEALTFLKTLDTFSDWSQEPSLSAALADLARRCEVWSFREGDLVRFPDEASSGETWVAEGCLVVLENKAPRYVGVRERLTADSGFWVRGQTAGRFVVVPQAGWLSWLRDHAAAADRLGEVPPPPLPRGLQKSPLVLEPGEIPVHLFRKAPLFLVLRAALPVVFFLLFLAFGLTVQFGLESSLPAWALWLLPGVGMTLAASLVALVAWEWSASVLVITDRSVLIRQVDVWAHRSDFEKLSLERIREAVLKRSGWFDALLGLVSLEIEGDSPKGRLVFTGLTRGSRFVAALDDLRARRSALSPERRIIRAALAGRAGGSRSPVLETAAIKSEQKRTNRLSWRVEKNGVLWFRRHFWYVVRHCMPWAGWTALCLFLGFFAAALAPNLVWPISGATFLLAAYPLGRIGWEIWDWADDTLSIQGDKIILVHKRPLWLGEVRQEGSLEQVQQVGVRKESLAALVLDFGVVTVSLGAATTLEFRDAAHPEWVQNEIFYRRTLLSQDRERQASRQRLDEVSEILDTWDEARKAGYFADKEQA